MSHLVMDLGLVDFDLNVPPFCPAAWPLLPNSHQLRHSWADSGTITIQVNPTQVPDQMGHPVHKVSAKFSRQGELRNTNFVSVRCLDQILDVGYCGILA